MYMQLQLELYKARYLRLNNPQTWTNTDESR